MTINTRESFESPLSLFSSLYEDMAPTDLPDGLSPDNEDVWYQPGQVMTRPGLQRYLPGPPAQQAIISLADFPLPDGNYNAIYLDDQGVLWFRDLKANVTGTLGFFTPGVQFKQATAFQKQFYACYGEAISQAAIQSPFVGVDVPVYYNGRYLSRVTSDPPATNPAYANNAAVGSLVTGARLTVTMFVSADGRITGASVPGPVDFSGGHTGQASAIPLGPPGTVARILAFTPANGSSFYYIPTKIRTPGSGFPLTSTVINDNTSTIYNFDFAEADLLSGVQIDIDGNNLFNQVVLAPCLGVIEYQGRLGWWGEINNIKNFVNMGFDGGTLGGLPDARRPLGWGNFGITTGSYFIDAAVGGNAAMGLAVRLVGAGNATDAVLSQPAFHDYYGAPIVQPGKNYMFMLRAACSDSLKSGNLQADLFSVSTGFVSRVIISIGGLGAVSQWVSAKFSFQMPQAIPSDMTLTVYLANSSNVVTIDDLMIIDADQPVLAQQMRVSYFDNEFGYDVVSGLIGFDTSDSITGAFELRGYLYVLTDQGLRVTQNNGTTEPFLWTESKMADNCGCSGPNAVDTGDDSAIWAGRYGLQFFRGETPQKISQEIQKTWDTINWGAETAIWVTNDSIQRVLYVGIPELNPPANSDPLWATKVLPLNYRSVNATYNIPDPLHISYSGKMICSDLCRKWTRWNVSASSGAMITQAQPGGGNIVGMALGGNGVSNLYVLDMTRAADGSFARKTDDDFGVIPSYWITSFFWNHETEQNAPQLGLHRKLFTYLSMFVTGAGNVVVTPYVDSLLNPWQPIGSIWNPITLQWDTDQPVDAIAIALSLLLTHDLEWRLNVRGDRVAFKIEVLPLDGQTDAGFNLQHMVVSGRRDNIMPVRGAIL